MQEELSDGWLPAGDAARDDGLRNAQLSEALREVADSLKEVPTPAALQRRRDRAWAPAVGDRCEGRYRAGADGRTRRTKCYPGEIVGEGAAGAFCVSYDDGVGVGVDTSGGGVGTTARRPPPPAAARRVCWPGLEPQASKQAHFSSEG